MVPAQTPGGTSVVLPLDPLGRQTGYAQLVQPNGSVLRPPGQTVNLPVSSRTIQAASGQSGAFFEDQRLGGVHVRVLTSPLPAGGGPSAGAIQAVKTLEDVDRSLRNLAFALIAVSLGGIALAVSLGRVVARTALTPVVQLTNTAEWVARTRDLSRRMDSSGSDELSRLGASFNTMLEALDDSQKAQRQLVADASHELRTPLTSLRTNIEVLENADSLSPEDRRRLLHDVVAQLEELTVLVSDLVDLARGVEPDFDTEEVRLDDACLGGGRARPPSCQRQALRAERGAIASSGRAGAHRPRHLQPARQRGQVEPSRQHHRRHGQRRRGCGARPRSGYRAVGPAADIRALLPRILGTRPSGLRAWAGDREAGCREPRWQRLGRNAARGGALFRLRLPALDRDSTYAGGKRQVQR